MRGITSRYVWMAVAVAALVLVAAAAALVVTQRRVPASDDVLPASTLAPVGDGGAVDLDRFRGRPLVLSFYASWCVVCVPQMQALEDAHRSSKGRVRFLGVATQDSADAAVRHARRAGVSYTLAADPEGRLYDDLGLQQMPATVFVDARGVVLERADGPLSEKPLRRALRRHFRV